MNRTIVINKLIAENGLKSYLEIGVSNPEVNFLKIKCEKKVSVDPCIECEYYSKDEIEGFKEHITHQMTSDEFFSGNKEKFDIVFIDGEHTYEQSLKDLNNALKAVYVNGFVVLHDTMPISFEATQIENFKNKMPYNGEVWKTALSAIKTNRGKLKIGTFPFDFGVCVIKKLSEDIPEIPELDFDYQKDFSLPSMLPICDIRIFYHKKVSFFTSLFNTPQEVIERTAKTVLNQENRNWEWVVVDDSDNNADAERLKCFFEKIADSRVKYHRFTKQTGGNIGLAKKRATSLCTGDFLAELDHDDLLMLDLTDTILDNAGGYDFIYTNFASVVVLQGEMLINGEMFPRGFAMGYGMYRMTYAENPLTERFQEFAECVCPPINPKTIRSIVGVPNHIRIWSKRFYDMIGGHNPEMPLADDYDLIIRSFLAGGRFLHLDILGYLQTEYKSRTVHKKNDDIQFYWNTILVVNNELIKGAFEMRGMQDWAYEYYQKNFGFKGFYSENRDGAPEKMCIHGYKYFEVPTVLNAPAANSIWIPKG